MQRSGHAAARQESLQAQHELPNPAPPQRRDTVDRLPEPCKTQVFRTQREVGRRQRSGGGGGRRAATQLELGRTGCSSCFLAAWPHAGRRGLPQRLLAVHGVQGGRGQALRRRGARREPGGGVPGECSWQLSAPRAAGGSTGSHHSAAPRARKHVQAPCAARTRARPHAAALAHPPARSSTSATA